MQTAPKNYDDAKLAAMVEPLTVRVDRIVRGAHSPIPLPNQEGDDRPSGTEWTKDDVRGLEQFLVTQWTGGGLYQISVTDSTVPNPLIMKWQPYWKPEDYPELVPPPLQEARAAGSAPPPTVANQSQQVNVPMNPRFPHGFPTTMPMPANFGGHQQQQPYGMPNYGMGVPPQVGTASWMQWQAEVDKRKVDEELKQLRESRETEARAAAEARHKAELERVRAESEAKASVSQRAVESQVNELRNLVTSLATTVRDAAHAKPVGPDPSVVALQEQIRQQQAQMENDRREREAERREALARDEMRRLADETNRRMEQMQAQHREQMAALQTQFAANASNKPDQLVMLMQEQSRQNAEAIKEIARTNQSTIDRIQAQILNPRDMIDLAMRQSQAQESATERTVKFFGNVVDMQQKVTENLLNMQPGGSGIVDVVREGMAGVKEVAEKYVGAKSMSERFAMQAQADVANAQSRAIEAQAYAASGQMPPQTVHAPPPPRVEQQLAGPPMPTPSTTKRLGKTDHEWFGILLPEVEELRLHVAHFIESCKMDPVRVDKDDNIEGAAPEHTAFAIVSAAQEVARRRIMIPVMVELAGQHRYADFVDVLIPDATSEYRTETTTNMIDMLKKMAGDTTTQLTPPPPRKVKAQASIGDDDDDDDDDNDGDDDDGDADPDQDGKAVAAPAKPSKPPVVVVRPGNSKKPAQTTH